MGGAHRDPEAALTSIADAIALALTPLQGMTAEALRSRRREKFLAMGKLALT